MFGKYGVNQLNPPPYKVNKGLSSQGYGNIYIPPATVRVFAFVIGRARGVYRTSDSGANWNKVYDGAVPISAIAGFGWGPTVGREVLVGDKKGGLYLSKDAGLHWTKQYTFTGCGEISSIATSSKSVLRQVYFVGTTACGAFTTTDGGQSFNAINAGLEDSNVRGITMSSEFQDDETVFLTTGSKAVYISKNAGRTWSLHGGGLVTDPQGVDHQFLGVRASPNYMNDKTLFLEGFSGIFKSIDGGLSWKEMDAMPGMLIQSLALSPSYAEDGSLLLSTYLSGLYQTHNKGASWTSMADQFTARNSDIIYSPSYRVDRVIFAAVGLPNRILKSQDGGRTWKQNDVSCIPTILAISPDYPRDQTLYAACRSTHLLRSSDGGQSYTTVYREEIGDRCPYCVSALVLSPNFTRDKTILYATETLGSGVQMSQDSGNTWITKGNKAEFGKHIKLAFSPDYTVDHTIFIGGTKGLFRSEDGLESWKKITGESSGIDGYIEEVAVSSDYKNDHTLLISVRGKGLFKSLDRGNSYHPIGISIMQNNHIFGLWDDFPVSTSSLIRFSPSYSIDKTIYGSSSDWLFRSTDAGETWKAILKNTDLRPVAAPEYPIGTEPVPVAPPMLYLQVLETGKSLNASAPIYPGPHARLSLIKRGKGHGIVTSIPKGILCGDICDYQFTKKTKVSLRVAPNLGSKFLGWSGTCNDKKAVCIIKMKRNKSVKVRLR